MIGGHCTWFSGRSNYPQATGTLPTMTKPPHTRAAMRAFYPICQVAELAAGYGYMTGHWRYADEPNVHVCVTNRVPPVRPWGRYTLGATRPGGASAPTSARPSHHLYTSDRYTVASRPGWPDGPD